MCSWTLVQLIPFQREPYLLYSNCNVHNFIFDKDGLREIIDPTSVILSTAL